MNIDWRTFLEQQGAVIEQQQVVHFGNPDHELEQATNGEILCDLSHNGLLAVSGADSIRFLQGQLTNDVNQVTVGHSQLSAYCSPKGRVLVLFRLFKRDDCYYLTAPHERMGVARERLQMFVLRDKVALNEVSDELIGIGLHGANAEMLLTDALGKIPNHIDEVLQLDKLSILRIAGEQARFCIYGDLKSIKNLWQKLAVSATPAGQQTWRLLDIRCGIPNVYQSTADAFVPQMLNLQLLDGISFDKGCYVGQEIVARTKYLGKLKRRMYRIYFNGDELPPPATELYAPMTKNEQSIGKLVDCCASPDGGYEALAVLVIECVQDDEEILLGDIDGALIAIDELPYIFEEQAEDN